MHVLSKHSQASRSTHLLRSSVPLFVLPVSARGPIIEKDTFLFIRKKWNYSKHWSWRIVWVIFLPKPPNISELYKFSVSEKCIVLVSQLKTAGTQKVFPLSPLRTPLTPSPKNKVCNPSLGGTGGTLFTQHYSCPAVLRCSMHQWMAASLGTLLVCESCLLAQWLVSHCTRQQGGSVEPPWSFAYQASLVHSLPVAQKEKQKAELAPHNK